MNKVQKKNWRKFTFFLTSNAFILLELKRLLVSQRPLCRGVVRRSWGGGWTRPTSLPATPQLMDSATLRAHFEKFTNLTPLPRKKWTRLTFWHCVVFVKMCRCARFKFKHIFKVCMNNLNVAVIIIITQRRSSYSNGWTRPLCRGVSDTPANRSWGGGVQCSAGLKCQEIIFWRTEEKKFYGVYPVRTIIRHPAKRSYRHQARQAILTIWRKKFYGVYLVRTIVRHPAKRSEMPRNHILANWRKKVLWSLPCPYDNPTPSEAFWHCAVFLWKCAVVHDSSSSTYSR